MPDAEDPATLSINALDKMGCDIRKALLSTLPCASDQYVCISMPGRVIDTNRGGEFIKSEVGSAVELHQIRVSEARLVDSMIPLDKVMLGPTGKSVSRSYLAALDNLIPIDSEVRVPSMTPTNTSEKQSNYVTAMNYLRKPIAIQDSSKQGERKQTVVDIYVEKQLQYVNAQIDWDNQQDKNAADHELGKGKSADELAITQSRMRTAKFKLQARWMDWVVNGDKITVDHHFAVVDVSTIMSRIEASKEAARAANILDIFNGTQWAQVILEPKNWADYCRQKAEGWSKKNPLSPAVIELEIKRLENLKAAYEGYRQGTTQGSDEVALVEDSGESKAIMDLNKNQAELDALKKITPADTSKIEAAEKKLKESKSAVAALQGIEKNKGIVKALDSAMSKGMTASLAKKIADLDKEITKLRGHLAQCNAEFQRGVNTIVGVVEEKKLPAASGDQAGTDAKLTCVMANEHETGADRNLLMGGAQPAGQPDPWTKIIFTSSASSESSSSTEKSMSREAKAKIKAFWWGAQANTSSSEASKELRKKAAKQSVSGSFSALLVKITRPWLHAELFSDYEIDAPENNKMSPGPIKFNSWLKDRDQTELSRYGTFPAYPTAFIVAADVELEISCDSSFTTGFMESGSSDSSFEINYGPWRSSASANLKTSHMSTNQRMEATSSGMKLSFQAPQIIGWVCEILPELPRNKDPFASGGLVGAPMNLFRH